MWLKKATVVESLGHIIVHQNRWQNQKHRQSRRTGEKAFQRQSREKEEASFGQSHKAK